MKVLAVSGWKGSGKDAIADYLVKEHNFIRLAFADVLKDTVAQQYEIDIDSCYDQDKKEVGIKALPVETKDSFSEEIHRLLFKEFKDLQGLTPYIDYNSYLTRDKDITSPLFWTPRALCILEGSVKRSVNSFYWVRCVLNKMLEFAATGETPAGVVIPDLRYRSEVEQLKSFFPETLEIIRVNRFESVNSEDASERDLDNYEFSCYINNRGSLEDLYKKVDALVSQ